MVHNLPFSCGLYLCLSVLISPKIGSGLHWFEGTSFFFESRRYRGCVRARGRGWAWAQGVPVDSDSPWEAYHAALRSHSAYRGHRCRTMAERRRLIRGLLDRQQNLTALLDVAGLLPT